LGNKNFPSLLISAPTTSIMFVRLTGPGA
jgi:hypothetical protein